MHSRSFSHVLSLQSQLQAMQTYWALTSRMATGLNVGTEYDCHGDSWLLASCMCCIWLFQTEKLQQCSVQPHDRSSNRHQDAPLAEEEGEAVVAGLPLPAGVFSGEAALSLLGSELTKASLSLLTSTCIDQCDSRHASSWKAWPQPSSWWLQCGEMSLQMMDWYSSQIMILSADKGVVQHTDFSISVMKVHATRPLSACVHGSPYNSKIAWWRAKIAQWRRDAAIANDVQSTAADVIEWFLSYEECFVQNPNTFLPVVHDMSGMLQAFHGDRQPWHNCFICTAMTNRMLFSGRRATPAAVINLQRVLHCRQDSKSIPPESDSGVGGLAARLGCTPGQRSTSAPAHTAAEAHSAAAPPAQNQESALRCPCSSPATDQPSFCLLAWQRQDQPQDKTNWWLRACKAEFQLYTAHTVDVRLACHA